MDQDGDGREPPLLCLREDGLTVELGWLESESGSQALKQWREVGAQDDAGATREETVWGEPNVGSSGVFLQGGGGAAVRSRGWKLLTCNPRDRHKCSHFPGGSEVQGG